MVQKVVTIRTADGRRQTAIVSESGSSSSSSVTSQTHSTHPFANHRLVNPYWTLSSLRLHTHDSPVNSIISHPFTSLSFSSHYFLADGGYCVRLSASSFLLCIADAKALDAFVVFAVRGNLLRTHLSKRLGTPFPCFLHGSSPPHKSLWKPSSLSHRRTSIRLLLAAQYRIDISESFQPGQRPGRAHPAPVLWSVTYIVSRRQRS